MDDVLDTTGVARRGGAAGALTNGRVDRAGALATADDCGVLTRSTNRLIR